MMRKTFIALLLFVSGSLFIVSCTQPVKQKTIDKILKEKIIIVGTTGEQFPFSFKEDNGELKGIDINIAKLLAKELGVDVKFEILPFDKLIPAVSNGKVDIVFSGVTITTKGNTEVAFPGVYFKSGKSIITKNKQLYKGAAEYVNTENITLAVTKATTSEDFVKDKYPKTKLILVKNITEAVKLLSEDKIDGIVADFETCELIAFSYKESYLYFKNLSIPTEKEFISPVVASDDYLFINLISNFIERINANDEYEAVDMIWYEFLN